MDEKKEQHWEKYRQPKTQKSKLHGESIEC